MVDVFEQVEEELRSERYKRLARVWLPVAGAILAIALIGALSWWGLDSYNSNKAAKGAEAYDRGMEAVQEGRAADARAAFEEAVKVGNGAYKALALQQQAGLALSADRVEDAVRLLDEAAKASRDPILSDPAAYKAALLLMDTAPLEEMERRLQPLTKEDRPLSVLATEALAMARLQHGKTSEAREAFVQLQFGQNVPEPVGERATAAIAMIDGGASGNLKAIIAAANAAAPQATGAANAPTQTSPAAAPAPAQQ